MNTYIFKISFILFFTSFLASCQTNDKEEQIGMASVKSQPVKPKKVKNIIFLIGDGMGLSQVSASLFFNENPSNFERFSVIGLSKTSSSSVP